MPWRCTMNLAAELSVLTFIVQLSPVILFSRCLINMPSEQPATTATNSLSPDDSSMAFCVLTLLSMRFPSIYQMHGTTVDLFFLSGV